MHYNRPITDIIKQRFSCRTYVHKPIAEDKRKELAQAAARIRNGPFGSRLRLELIAATEDTPAALKGLGTYGFTSGNTGFIIGAVGEGEKNLEDYGYRLEQLVLHATTIGLGTCWLGGSFNKSAFASRTALAKHETLPAVVAVGHISDRRSLVDRMIRRRAAPQNRLAWEHLFFDGGWGDVLTRTAAGAAAVALEMVRLAPSASNRQPWRLIRKGERWHFYLRRSQGYRKRNHSFFGVADMQRLDIGIAMSHFEMTGIELGLKGNWELQDPGIVPQQDTVEYVATWKDAS